MQRDSGIGRESLTTEPGTTSQQASVNNTQAAAVTSEHSNNSVSRLSDREASRDHDESRSEIDNSNIDAWEDEFEVQNIEGERLSDSEEHFDSAVSGSSDSSKDSIPEDSETP